jgi:hypothetical protein
MPPLCNGDTSCQPHLAQARRRFGSRVTVIEQGPQLASREDPDVGAALLDLFHDEGIEYDALRKRLERTGESQISLSDPDSRAMAAHTKVGVGYNVQIAVDAKHKMIVERAVTNGVLDMGLLRQTAEPARQILDVDTIDVVADNGYFKSEDIDPVCDAFPN